ncbi:adult cuticle protein 1 [Wyeomyia smithii]|uniref:adult cuticle protein 1 n=1 Tax=Wyeomyia smithii TaxID=174621 RepID=UPI002467E389|nr:adult cuticle protein 1 [Wyeomyia smithii]
MKCFVALLIAALSLIAEGSVIPLILPAGIPYPLPAALAIPEATVIQSNPAPAAVVVPGLPGPVTIDASGIPVVLAPAPAVAAVAPAPGAATSVSATRGAVHVAPLPGHSVSQQQLNLAPAPGSE